MLYEQNKKDYYGFNDDFFVISDARPIADSNIYLRRTKLDNLAGLKVIRSHDFRHSCASLLINNGAKYLFRTYKIEETLNTYSHIFSTALDSVVSVIDSFRRWLNYFFNDLYILNIYTIIAIILMIKVNMLYIANQYFKNL